MKGNCPPFANRKGPALPVRSVYNRAVSDLSSHLSASRIAGIPVRVSVELGRAERPLAEAVSLEPGQIVPLDRDAQAPADIYVDGMLYARGQASSVDGRWAVKLEEVLVDSKPDFLALPEPVVEEEPEEVSEEEDPAEPDQ